MASFSNFFLAHTDTCTLNVSKTTSTISKSKAIECKTLKVITTPSLSIEIIPIYFIGHDVSRAHANGRVKLGDVRDGKSDGLIGLVEIEMTDDGSWVGVPLKVEYSSVTVHFENVQSASKWMFNVTGKLSFKRENLNFIKFHKTVLLKRIFCDTDFIVVVISLRTFSLLFSN